MTFPPITRTIRTLLLSIVFATTFSIIYSVPAQAIEQGGVGGRPAHPKADNIRSESIFVHQLKPGEVAKDGVEVINNTAETKRILVYAVDSQVSSGGAFACAQAADAPVAVGQWIALPKKEVTLASGSKQIVDFTVATPKDASPGEHNGCIVVQDTKQRSSPDSNGIVLTMRSAIRIAVTVPGDIQKGLVFTGLGMASKGSDNVLLSAGLKNNGNVSLDTQLDVRLVYAVGLAAVKAGGNFPVLSSSEGRFNFEAERPFWGGWYRLSATAKYNDNPETSLGEGKPTASIRQSQWLYIAPDPMAVAIEITLFVFVATAATLLARRNLHTKQIKKAAKKHIVSSGENLHTIAKKYHMPWKQLARLNKLRPPYQLDSGQSLIVTSLPEKKHSRKSSLRP